MHDALSMSSSRRSSRHSSGGSLRHRPALSPLTQFRSLPTTTTGVDDSAIDDEDETPDNAGDRDTPDMLHELGEKINELSRRLSVDVEAAAGPALFAARPRTGSASTVRSRHGSRLAVSFAAEVHDGKGREFLPRIDSEKTLAPSEGSPEQEVAVLPKDSPEPLALEAATPEQPHLSRTRKILLGFVMMMEVLVSSMASNAVVLTIPSVAADLGIDAIQAQWVSSAYSLAYGCGLLFAGRLADIYGRRYLFLGGLLMATIFNICCGVVSSLIPLCVMRALVGLGLAIATPAAFGIVGVAFREDTERTIAFACFGLGNPIGASVGMLVGGGVSGINAHGWKYLYFVLAGLSALPGILGLLLIPTEPKRDTVDKRIDWLGGLLITAALCLFTFSITESGIAPNGWKTPYIPALLVISLVLLAAFCLWEHRVEHTMTLQPIAKLSMFTRDGGKISAVLTGSSFTFFAIAAWVYLVALFYQEYKGLGPLANAIRTLPASLMGIGAALCVMWVVPRLKAPLILILGAFLSGLACLLFAVCPADTVYWGPQFISMLLLPFGADLTVGVGSILVSNLCADDEQSVGGALFQTTIQISSALGICISSLVTTSVGKNGFLQGLRAAFGLCTGMAWVVIVITAVFLRKMGLAKDVGSGKALH